jgi:hypothetical protein
MKQRPTPPCRSTAALPPFLRRMPVLLLLLTLALAHVFPASVLAGWQWQGPPTLVNMQSNRRGHVFYKGEAVALKLSGPGASKYVIRDYYGNIVEQGALNGTVLVPGVTEPGWYKVNFYGGDQGMPWGNSVGSGMFCILRDDPNFPRMPAPGTFGGEGLVDEITRGVMGYGPQRHKVDNASAADSEIPRLDAEIALDQKYYMPFDPYRKRELLIVFPNGTWDLAGVRKIVEHFKGSVKYWEPRNEPNFSTGATAFVKNELAPFYALVKSVDPTLKVIAPGAVTVGPPMAGWNDEFFRAGGGKYIDAFSFHAYNCVNGDLNLTRMSMDQVNGWLSRYNLTGLEKWQTEQGFLGPVYGAYQPRMQGRWTMLQMMVYEQYGIPKEHNHYWYDRNGGFWDEPRWVQNEDGSINPVGVLLRVWSEELYGTRFERSLDFGNPGNKLYVGSVFSGPGKQMAALMTSGDTRGQLDVSVPNAASIKVVSPFGKERTVALVNGKVTLPVSELPTYVEYAGTLSVAPLNWGTNLVQQGGVTAAASGSSVHPINPGINNPPGKVINGKLDTWYWNQGNDDRIWESNNATYPAWFEVRLPAATQMDRVVVYAGIPWQWDGSILDYELQVEQGGQWVSLERIQEPVNTLRAYTQTNRTSVDSFYSERCIFTHSFAPVTTAKIRLLVHDVTWGGASNKDLKDAGAQGGEHQLNLREIEIYRSGAAVSSNAAPAAVGDSATCYRGGSVSIPVLANDTNTDGGPFALSIVSVGEPKLGRVAIVGDQLVYTAAQALSGPDQFTYTISDGASSATSTVAVNVLATVQPLGVDTHGLFAEYFNNADFTAPAFSRVDPYVDNNWGTNAPDPAVDAGSFSIRWTGKVRAKYTELYAFSTLSDDGVRLWVNGKALVNNWNPHPGTVDAGSIQLEAGQLYDIKLEYFQGGGGAQISLFWSSPSQTREVVPFDALTLGAPVTVVPPANRMPVAGKDTAWTPQGSSTLINVLLNDSDADAAPLPLKISAVGAPGRGTAVLSDTRIQYTPEAGFAGADAFTYTITDGEATATATVTVTVAAPDPTRWAGLKGEYFGAADLTVPLMSRLDAAVNFDWLLGAPATGIPADGFSARWSGAVTPRFTESYTFYATSDDGVRLWVNGVLIADNWSDHAPAEVSGSIKLVAGALCDIKMEYYERTGGAQAQLRWSSPSLPKEVIPSTCLSTPPFTGGVAPPPPPQVLVNRAPVAVDDTASTNEGVAVTVPVLANDSDPDAAPQALLVSAVGAPARGSATLAGGGVVYLPQPGFTGVDQFAYTISDGSATASAVAVVTVKSTALVNSLVSSGMSAVQVGVAVGSSRILADGSWELNGTGGSVSGTADALRMEAVTVTGDFRVMMRVRGLTGSAAARAGLLLREGTQPGDRCVLGCVTPSAQVRSGARLVANGAYSETASGVPEAQAVFPEAWLQLERMGDSVRVLVSSNGAAFQPVAAYTVAGLGASLQVGAVATGGAPDATVRAVVDQWSVQPVVGAGSAPFQAGLLGVYYASSNLTLPVAARVDETVNFDWGNGTAHPAVAGDNFSARWSGYVVAPTSGLFTFYTQADDGVRLWVNGKQLVSDWTPHAITENSGTVELQAGVPVEVKLEYFESGGQAVCRLLWSGPSVNKQTVPVGVLRPALVPTALGAAVSPAVRLLADGSRELAATGAGLKAGALEQGGFLNEPHSGDFQMAFRLRALSGSSSVAMMLREGMGAADRFAALQWGLDGGLSLWSRATVGGAVTRTPVAGSLSLPDAWLLLERRGDKILLAFSPDDKTYTNSASLELAGLPQLVYAGAFLGGSSGGTAAKAVVGEYELNPISLPGLTGEYFGSSALSGLRMVRVDPSVDFVWGSGSPDPRLPADSFSVRWTGRLKTRAAGSTTFFVQSDDGVRLWLNGQLVINNWTDHAVTENSVTLSLGAGASVDVRLEYYEKAGSATARLLWTTPGQPKQVIPVEQLRTP